MKHGHSMRDLTHIFPKSHSKIQILIWTKMGGAEVGAEWRVVVQPSQLWWCPPVNQSKPQVAVCSLSKCSFWQFSTLALFESHADCRLVQADPLPTTIVCSQHWIAEAYSERSEQGYCYQPFMLRYWIFIYGLHWFSGGKYMSLLSPWHLNIMTAMPATPCHVV